VTQFAHTVLGSNLGAASPALDVPRLATLLAVGKLDLASLVTHRFRLEEINHAIEVVESGEAGGVVIDFT
jgi:Zn-dependent alcohol dehydrogenase